MIVRVPRCACLFLLVLSLGAAFPAPAHAEPFDEVVEIAVPDPAYSNCSELAHPWGSFSLPTETAVQGGTLEVRVNITGWDWDPCSVSVACVGAISAEVHGQTLLDQVRAGLQPSIADLIDDRIVDLVRQARGAVQHCLGSNIEF